MVKILKVKKVANLFMILSYFKGMVYKKEKKLTVPPYCVQEHYIITNFNERNNVKALLMPYSFFPQNREHYHEIFCNYSGLYT